MKHVNVSTNEIDEVISPNFQIKLDSGFNMMMVVKKPLDQPLFQMKLGKKKKGKRSMFILQFSTVVEKSTIIYKNQIFIQKYRCSNWTSHK